MPSFVQLLVIAAAISVACGQNLYLNSSARDYYQLARRELINQIEITEIQIASVNTRYANRLAMIELQQGEVLIETKKVNRTLMPLQALSLVRKHCIQKYDSQLPTYDKVKSQLKVCYDKAVLAAATLTSGPETSVRSAKEYAVVDLPRRVVECDKTFPKDKILLEKCYTTSVNDSTEGTNYFLGVATDQLKQSLFNASTAANTAVQCSFRVERDALKIIGKTNKLMSDCEDASK